MARVLAKKNVAKILRAAQSGDEVAEDAQGKLPDGHSKVMLHMLLVPTSTDRPF